MRYFGISSCPYCKKSVNVIRVWSLKKRGEYMCPRCKGISNIYLSPLVYVVAAISIASSFLIYFFQKFVSNTINLMSPIEVIIPFIAFFLLSLFMVYLEKPVIKTVKKTSDGRYFDQAGNELKMKMGKLVESNVKTINEQEFRNSFYINNDEDNANIPVKKSQTGNFEAFKVSDNPVLVNEIERENLMAVLPNSNRENPVLQDNNDIYKAVANKLGRDYTVGIDKKRVGEAPVKIAEPIVKNRYRDTNNFVANEPIIKPVSKVVSKPVVKPIIKPFSRADSDIKIASEIPVGKIASARNDFRPTKSGFEDIFVEYSNKTSQEEESKPKIKARNLENL